MSIINAKVLTDSTLKAERRQVVLGQQDNKSVVLLSLLLKNIDILSSFGSKYQDITYQLQQKVDDLKRQCDVICNYSEPRTKLNTIKVKRPTIEMRCAGKNYVCRVSKIPQIVVTPTGETTCCNGDIPQIKILSHTIDENSCCRMERPIIVINKKVAVYCD